MPSEYCIISNLGRISWKNRKPKFDCDDHIRYPMQWKFEWPVYAVNVGDHCRGRHDAPVEKVDEFFVAVIFTIANISLGISMGDRHHAVPRDLEDALKALMGCPASERINKLIEKHRKTWALSADKGLDAFETLWRSSVDFEVEGSARDLVKLRKEAVALKRDAINNRRYQRRIRNTIEHAIRAAGRPLSMETLRDVLYTTDIPPHCFAEEKLHHFLEKDSKYLHLKGRGFWPSKARSVDSPKNAAGDVVTYMRLLAERAALEKEIEWYCKEEVPTEEYQELLINFCGLDGAIEEFEAYYKPLL